MKNNSKIKSFLLVLFGCMYQTTIAQLKVSSLSVEHMKNPTTVDAVHPRLSWINEVKDSSVRGEKQTAYRVVVSSSEEKLENGEYDLWDSGRIPSERSTLIPYAGKELQSGQDCYWKVQVWNKNKKASAWSATAQWGMGLLKDSDWKATWIKSEQEKGAPLFRKAFTLKKKIEKAKAFVTSGGYFELYLNGTRVGEDYLVPNFTNYTPREGLDKGNLALANKFTSYRILYLAYNITNLLKDGVNAVGAVLGDGFYRSANSRWVKSFGTPCLLCQIEITYEDGTKEILGTDESWLTKPSAITMNGVYDGEIYDARRETPLWAEPHCNEEGWKRASIAEAPKGKLTAHTSPTDQICEILHPVCLTKITENEYEVEFKKEISGWIRLKNIKAESGNKIEVKYICESPLGIQEYICNGNGNESYAPRFTWYVFSKAIVKGIKGLKPSQLQAEAVNTDVRINSKFHTSNPLLNSINTIWQQSQIDNMHGCVASDCPHRERSPYTGDGQIAAEMVMLNFDASAFYQKWVRDMRDAQNPESGYVPNGAPWQPGCGGGVAWGAAMNVIPWEYYRQYGDLGMLHDNYQAMKDQMKHMLEWVTPEGTMYQQKLNEESNEVCYWFNLGDWVPPFGLPSDEIIHTFYLWLCADYTAQAAKTMGKTEDYHHYRNIAERTKKAFHKKFYDPQAKSYGDYGPNILALKMGVPAERHADVVKTLRREIMETHNGHIHTGFVTTKFFFETLSENGLHDVAMTVINKTDFPSYGNWIRQGATVTWENWNGNDSHNHPMFGGGLTWFARVLAGLNVTTEGAGYRHFVVRPIPTEHLDSVHYELQTPQGMVSSNVISHKGELRELKVNVPVGSEATICIPAPLYRLKESGRRVRTGNGITHFRTTTNGFIEIDVKQGNYHFTVE